MSAPYIGKRVEVVGTSRAELNGSVGVAQDYDSAAGRYTVRLDSGKVVALKVVNLQEAPPCSSSTSSANGAAASAAPNGSSAGGGPGGIPWPTVGLVLMAAMWLWQVFQGSGSPGGSSLWGDDEAEYDLSDEGYLSGAVLEASTLDQYRGALAHHSDNTGLPVVVDFFSHSCGPCRMIAPTFKRLAKEYKGRAVFLKVDVNRNYEAASACNIRGMPTFQFYLHKKKVSEFSGADDRSLRRYTDRAVEMSEDAGVYAGQEVTGAALRAFYERYDQSKVPQAEALAEKYSAKTALLMRVSKQKYGSVPETSPRAAQQSDEREAGGGHRAAAAAHPHARDVSRLSTTELQAEAAALREELQRRGAPLAEVNSPVPPQPQRASTTGAGAVEEDDDDDDVPFLSADSVAGAGVHRLVIIGGGPAGLSAATYAARAGLRPLVLAPAFGGQLLGKGVDVENYPGVVGEYATGRGLVELMRRQALSFDTRFVDTAVLSADFSKRPFAIGVNGTQEPIRAHAVILACGAESRWLRVAGEDDFRGRGVSACATCDGFLYRGKDVVVIGGGDTAMEDALHLARSSRRVTVVHRRDRLTASRVLAERVLNHSSIQLRWNATVESFHGGTDLSHVTLRCSAGKKERLDVSAAFVAIGHDPQTGFLKGQVDLDGAGYVTLRGSSTTSVPGVFAAGDVADPVYRQAITASGTGAMAALDAERYLNGVAD